MIRSFLQLALLANKDPTLWLEAASSAQKYVCKNKKININAPIL